MTTSSDSRLWTVDLLVTITLCPFAVRSECDAAAPMRSTRFSNERSLQARASAGSRCRSCFWKPGSSSVPIVENSVVGQNSAGQNLHMTHRMTVDQIYIVAFGDANGKGGEMAHSLNRGRCKLALCVPYRSFCSIQFSVDTYVASSQPLRSITMPCSCNL